MPPIHLQLAIHGIVGVPTSKKGVSVRFDRELEQFTSVAEIFHPVPVGLCRATELKQCCTRGNTLHKRVYSRDPEYFSEQTSELIAAPKKKNGSASKPSFVMQRAKTCFRSLVSLAFGKLTTTPTTWQCRGRPPGVTTKSTQPHRIRVPLTAEQHGIPLVLVQTEEKPRKLHL